VLPSGKSRVFPHSMGTMLQLGGQCTQTARRKTSQQHSCFHSSPIAMDLMRPYITVPPPSIVCCISDLLGVSDHYSLSYSLVPRKVIPFQKNGRQHGVNNFLAWSRAGDSHPELEPALVSALQRLEIKQDAPVKRKKGKTTRMVSLNELEKAKKKAVEDAKKSWVAKRPPKQTPPKTPLMPTSAVQPRTRAVKHMTSSAPADEDLDDSETDQVCISHDILFELI